MTLPRGTRIIVGQVWRGSSKPHGTVTIRRVVSVWPSDAVVMRVDWESQDTSKSGTMKASSFKTWADEEVLESLFGDLDSAAV